MIVVADAGPVHYLILLGKADLLPTPFGEVVNPSSRPRSPDLAPVTFSSPLGGRLVRNELCEANDVKNAVFIPAEEYGHDFYPWEKESGAGPP